MNKAFQIEIRRDIRKMHFPPSLSHDAPPTDFGKRRHGSLKASQWRTVCCFPLLVTLGRLWGSTHSSKQQQSWLENYIHLATLIRIAYSRSMTGPLIQAFRTHATEFIKGMKTLYPDEVIKPSHHYLLHLADLLEYFGPMPGWWAFAFERYNGFIQRTATNNHIGKWKHIFYRNS